LEAAFVLLEFFISFEKNFYRLPFTPPLSGSPYRSFSSFSHRGRADGLRVLDLRGADNHLQSSLAARWPPLLRLPRRPPRRPPPLSRGHLQQLSALLVSNSAWAPPPGCRPLQPRHLSTRRRAHQRLRLLFGSTIPSAEYLPSTTLASGNVAPAAGVSDSA
jgi:hypothetical protein